MTPRLARRLASLYPRSWRERYNEEFTAFLEGQPCSPSVLVNIIGCACREHARGGFAYAMTPARRLTLLMYACLAAMTAAVNLYWTIDDSAIVSVMRAHAAAAIFWRFVAFGAAAALVIAAAAALPVVRTLLIAAIRRRRYDLIARLSIPFCALAILVGWMSIVIARTHWAPTPWDIAGGWRAPASWPSLGARWVLGSITGALIAIGLGGSAIALRQAIEGAQPSESAYLRVTLSTLAAVLLSIAIAALAWGLLARVYAPDVFRSSDGIFGVSIAASWGFSLALFTGAALAAIRGARGAAPRAA
jgi:hypothetical protein